MSDEFDNRLRFPAPPIDFEDDVGITGQDHDTFPEPGQARFDHMRMAVIALLAHQSSDDDKEPSQKRTGTTWFARLSKVFKYFDGSDFKTIAGAIGLTEGDSEDEVLTLAEWFAIVQAQLPVLKRMTWSGTSSADDVDVIPVPESLQDAIEASVDDLRPLVYKNGILIDPRRSRFSSGSPVLIELLSGEKLDEFDKFTVFVESFSDFVVDEIIAS